MDMLLTGTLSEKQEVIRDFLLSLIDISLIHISMRRLRSFNAN